MRDLPLAKVTPNHGEDDAAAAPPPCEESTTGQRRNTTPRSWGIARDAA